MTLKNKHYIPLALFSVLCGLSCAGTPSETADSVFQNGYIYTVDAHNSVAQALAIKDGKIIYVGNNAGVATFIGKTTQITDLHGRTMMPGLIDGHMHPLAGGAQLLTCNLDYQPLTVQQFQDRIQACLDAAPAGDDVWLQVSNWYRQFMQPSGTDANRSTLDQLRTNRPILVTSSDYHSMLVNSRALQLADINTSTQDPPGGSITHDARNEPSGILEDDARGLILAKLPAPQQQDMLNGAASALDAMRRQGITSFLDAAASAESIGVFATLQQEGRLTARAHFAPVIDVDAALDPAKVIAGLRVLQQQFDQGPIVAAPSITVRNAKIFMDGVLEAPAQTAGLLKPYYINHGTSKQPDWRPGTSTGQVYFSTAVLKPMMAALAQAGFDPHLHAIGDRAVRQSLDAVAFMRKTVTGKDIRAAIAHDEIVDPADYARFNKLNVIPVMSYQWAKRGPDSVDAAQNILGPSRYQHMEPESSLYNNKARIAYGSDWPVDRLDEWFALKVGVTRTGDGTLGAKYDGKFNAEPGLTPSTVIRSITMNSAYELHQEKQTGSLEAGKLADLIVLDRNPLKIAAGDIARVHVVLTMVGGKVVWDSTK